MEDSRILIKHDMQQAGNSRPRRAQLGMGGASKQKLARLRRIFPCNQTNTPDARNVWERLGPPCIAIMKPREPNLSDRYQRPYGMPAPARREATHALDAAPRPKPRRVRRGAGSRPNAAVEAEYRKRLEFLVLSMHASVLYWMRAAYRAHEPVMAQDGSNESDEFNRVMGRAAIGSILHSHGRFRSGSLVGDESEAEATLNGGGDVERHLDGGGDAYHHISRLKDGGDAQAMMLLSQARQYDRMGYSLGLRAVRIAPDRTKWHSYFDPSRDEVITEGKFWRESAAERLHMMLHEIGHRGQGVDRSGYAKFKRLHLNKLSDFEAMANPVHLRDERAGHLHDIAEEVWAESYARWCLGLPMPAELKEFWDGRNRRGDRGVGGDIGIRGYGNDSAGDMAMDRRTPADHLRSAFARLRKRWEDRFDEAASKLARWFAQSAATRSDERLRRILKDGGLSVKFTPTKAMRDVQAATVQANVALIRSIPEQYLTQVEGIVARSVQTGRDLHQLSRDLQEELGVTKRRAALIAHNQNNMATSAMTRARQMELGLKAVWIHSHAGKEPRPSHLANDGNEYDPIRGWYDPDERKYIWPGILINCRCFSRTVIPGFKP